MGTIIDKLRSTSGADLVRGVVMGFLAPYTPMSLVKSVDFGTYYTETTRAGLITCAAPSLHYLCRLNKIPIPPRVAYQGVLFDGIMAAFFGIDEVRFGRINHALAVLCAGEIGDYDTLARQTVLPQILSPHTALPPLLPSSNPTLDDVRQWFAFADTLA